MFRNVTLLNFLLADKPKPGYEAGQALSDLCYAFADYPHVSIMKTMAKTGIDGVKLGMEVFSAISYIRDLINGHVEANPTMIVLDSLFIKHWIVSLLQTQTCERIQEVLPDFFKDHRLIGSSVAYSALYFPFLNEIGKVHLLGLVIRNTDNHGRCPTIFNLLRSAEFKQLHNTWFNGGEAARRQIANGALSLLELHTDKFDHVAKVMAHDYHTASYLIKDRGILKELVQTTDYILPGVYVDLV